MKEGRGWPLRLQLPWPQGSRGRGQGPWQGSTAALVRSKGHPLPRRCMSPVTPSSLRAGVRPALLRGPNADPRSPTGLYFHLFPPSVWTALSPLLGRGPQEGRGGNVGVTRGCGAAGLGREG